MIVSDDLFFNVVKDWEKRDISSEEKGRFVSAFLEEKKISMREFSRRTGIPKSTIQDWVSNRQMKKYAESKKNEVYSLAIRLIFLLGKNNVLDDKTKKKIRELRMELDKFDVIEI